MDEEFAREGGECVFDRFLGEAQGRGENVRRRLGAAYRRRNGQKSAAVDM
jgi:hypothetical protein